MNETITLIFKDESLYVLDTGSLKSLAGVLSVQKKKGDPVEIIGEGPGAKRLREHYRIYKNDPENYRADIAGDISIISHVSLEEAKARLDSVKHKLKLHK